MNEEIQREGAEPTTSAVRLAELATHPDPWVRYAVAANPATPVELLRALARDGERDVRLGLRSNAAAPPELLAGLVVDAAADASWSRTDLASNPRTPPEALAQLAEFEDDPYTTQAVARHPSTPLEIVLRLASRPGARGYLYRAAAAANSSVPIETVERWVAEDPADGAALPPDDYIWDSLTFQAANNAALPEARRVALLEGLARSASARVRWYVATHTLTPVPLLIELLLDAGNWNDGDSFTRTEWVYEAAERNPATPREAVEAARKRRPPA